MTATEFRLDQPQPNIFDRVQPINGGTTYRLPVLPSIRTIADSKQNAFKLK